MLRIIQPFLFMLALSLYVWVTPLPAYGGACPSLSAEEKIRKADAILIGEIEGSEYVGYKRAGLSEGQIDEYAEQNGETPLWKWKLYMVKVEKAFKGRLNDKLLMASPRLLSDGGRYIIFIEQNKDLPRYQKTMAGWVNDKCASTEYIYPLYGSGLLDSVEDYFSTMKFK